MTDSTYTGYGKKSFLTDVGGVQLPVKVPVNINCNAKILH